ncbi:hypothetical protein AB0L40_24100 [Patulibacter sp. NPDC049589]|uniref:hypothetical protein n=1 Tax=Patulibacter sp. NPDC049589 TaxID=3154731 RepID=UPI003440847A
MTDNSTPTVPVWTLATRDAPLPVLTDAGPMTAERLTELRGALAYMADQPIATLEVHPLPGTLDRRRGIPLDAASPLAQHLSQLVAETARSSTVNVAGTGEALYRMVIPAKVAGQLVRPMASKAVPGGIHGALMGSRGIAAQASFVPANAAAVGAAGGAGGAAGATVAGGAALTVAAPLVLMAVAVGASAYADQQRRKAIERITGMLGQLHDDALDNERAELEGCRDAVDKATALLLDQGKLGVSLGLDSAVHAIGKSIAAAERRLKRWQDALDGFPLDKPVELDAVTDAFPGADDEGGTFRAHLELADLAVALKRRVIILQAVEHAQGDPGNPFESFTRTLKADQQRVVELEASVDDVLVRLSSLELTRPKSRRPAFTTNQVEQLMRSSDRVRRLADGVIPDCTATDVSIDIARDKDGSIVVLPAAAA